MRMKMTGGAALVALAFVFLASCGTPIPYRGAGMEYGDGDDCRAVLKDNDALTQGAGQIAKKYADHPCWSYSKEEHTDYDLLVAEYDDQGWIQGSSNMQRSGKDKPTEDHLDAFLKQLQGIYDENQRNGLSVVLYVHGWHHNARPDDDNVVSFRKFLGEIAAAGRARKLREDKPYLSASGARRYADDPSGAPHRRVVGIYVGWAGESMGNIWGLTHLTFWERKNTAEAVSQGSVRELFDRLDHLRDCGRTGLPWQEVHRRANLKKPEELYKFGNRNVFLMTIGHSFGGLVAYRGTSSEFIGSAVRASIEDYVSRIGDLVFIVNPAFEGARYEPLFVAGQRIDDLKPDQLPTLVIATSEADLATKWAFPAARSINTIFEAKPGHEYDAVVKAVGHNPRYRTHKLSRCDSANDKQCISTCSLPDMRDKSAAELKHPASLGDIVQTETRNVQQLIKTGMKEKTIYLCGELKLERTEVADVPNNNPFWSVYTTGDIMDGHNDIFNPRFVTFSRQVYLSVVQARLGTPDPARCTR